MATAVMAAGDPVQLSASDTDLNTPANWTVVDLVARNPSGDCTFSASSASSPNSNRIQVNWTVDNVSSGRRGEIGLLLKSATYTPTDSGAIQSIDFRINQSTVLLQPGARLLIRQGGKYYVSPSDFKNTTSSSSGMEASSFYELNLTTTGTTGILTNTGSNPDFSEAGTLMEFGIWGFQASSGQAAGASTEGALDSGEFALTLNPVDDRLTPFANYTRTWPEQDAQPAAAAGLPNILIIMCDDLGYGDTSLTGHPAIRTPHLETLRSQGAFCSQYYSAANICSPSRTSMMTGRMPYRHGVYSFIRDAEDFVHMDHTEITLPQVMKKVGYQCANIGKWHLSHLDAITDEHLPTMRYYGFDYWVSSDNNLQILNKGGWWRNETRVGTIAGYAGTVVTDEVIDWLDNSRDENRPFLLLANYYEPHADSKAPSELSDYYEGLGHAAGPAQYYACVDHVDQQIGRMLEHFDSIPGLKDNTLVIFTSDHGPNPTAESRYGTSAPYRGTKYQCWDGSTHVPTIIRWPGQVGLNTEITEPIGSIDLLQTLSSIVGAGEFLPKDRPLDGTDFSSLLTGEGTFSRTTPLQWHYYKSSASSLSSGSPQVSMRLGDYVVVAWYDNPFSFNNVRWMPKPGNNNGIIEMDYITGTGTQADKTLSATQGTYGLYHITTDQHQDNNIYDPTNSEHLAMRDQLIQYHQGLRLPAPGWGYRTDAPDYTSFANWRNSHWSGADASDDLISGEEADPDADGSLNLREYALATDPRSQDHATKRYRSGVKKYKVGGVVNEYLTFEFNASADSAAKYTGNRSLNLSQWESDPAQFVLTNRMLNKDGTYRVFYRYYLPVGEGDLGPETVEKEFIRLQMNP